MSGPCDLLRCSLTSPFSLGVRCPVKDGAAPPLPVPVPITCVASGVRRGAFSCRNASDGGSCVVASGDMTVVFVGGAGGSGIGETMGAVASSGPVTSVEGGKRYCQSSIDSLDCSRCSSCNATEASAGRASTDRAAICAMNAATSALMPGHFVDTDGTSSCTCLNTSVTGLSAVNGTSPVNISHAMMPTEYRSP